MRRSSVSNVDRSAAAQRGDGRPRGRRRKGLRDDGIDVVADDLLRRIAGKRFRRRVPAQDLARGRKTDADVADLRDRPLRTSNRVFSSARSCGHCPAPSKFNCAVCRIDCTPGLRVEIEFPRRAKDPNLAYYRRFRKPNAAPAQRIIICRGIRRISILWPPLTAEPEFWSAASGHPAPRRANDRGGR